MSDEREMTLQEWCAKLPDCHLVNRELRELEAEVAGWKRAYDVDCSRLIERAEAAESLAATQRELLNEFEDKLNRQDAKLRAVAASPRHTTTLCLISREHGTLIKHFRDFEVIRTDELEALLKKPS